MRETQFTVGANCDDTVVCDALDEIEIGGCEICLRWGSEKSNETNCGEEKRKHRW